MLKEISEKVKSELAKRKSMFSSESIARASPCGERQSCQRPSLLCLSLVVSRSLSVLTGTSSALGLRRQRRHHCALNNTNTSRWHMNLPKKKRWHQQLHNAQCICKSIPCLQGFRCAMRKLMLKNALGEIRLQISLVHRKDITPYTLPPRSHYKSDVHQFFLHINLQHT